MCPVYGDKFYKTNNMDMVTEFAHGRESIVD